MFPAFSLSKLSVVCGVVVLVMVLTTHTGASRAHTVRASGRVKHTGGVSPLQLDTSSYLVHTRPTRDFSNHSISPWTYITAKDDDLIPSTLSEARCSLRGCLDANGVEDFGLESKPIWNQMLVLRKVPAPEGKSYQYRLESRFVSVGCTCVRPSVVQQKH